MYYDSLYSYGYIMIANLNLCTRLLSFQKKKVKAWTVTLSFEIFMLNFYAVSVSKLKWTSIIDKYKVVPYE